MSLAVLLQKRNTIKHKISLVFAFVVGIITFSKSFFLTISASILLSFISFVSDYFDNDNLKLIFIGTIFGLIIAYCVRFYSLAINGIKTGYEKLNKSLDDVSYLMGNSKLGTFVEVHFPFLKKT